jgi:enterochelin esterase family protein
MDAALKFKGYDYRFEAGTGGHDINHGAALLPDTLRWLWRDVPKE